MLEDDLYSASLRHQLYLEALKLGERERKKEDYGLYSAALLALLSKKQYSDYATVTQKNLRLLLRDAKRLAKAFYDSLAEDFVDFFEKFALVEFAINRDYMAETTGKGLTEAEETSGIASGAVAVGIAGAAAALTAASMWKLASASPLPSNGQTLQQFAASYANSNVLAVDRLIKTAYANKQKSNELIAAFVGTAENNYTDSQFRRSLRQSEFVFNTSLQHTSSVIDAAISSVYFKFYQWQSVLDDATTKICRERNGNVYVYGYGPLSPAHGNCRSKCVPLSYNFDYKPPQSTDWYNRQSAKFMADLFSVAPVNQKGKAQQYKIKSIKLNDYARKALLIAAKE
jgi:hypothetical protein